MLMFIENNEYAIYCNIKYIVILGCINMTPTVKKKDLNESFFLCFIILFYYINCAIVINV